MNCAYAYPKSRFEPATLIDLSARAERERLSESALKGFFRLAGAWQVRDEDARELLGGGLLAMQTVRRLLDARRGGL